MENLAQYNLAQASAILNLKKSQVANIKNGNRELTALETLLLKQASGDQSIYFYNWKPDDRLFWKNVDQLQGRLRFSDQKIAQLFGMSLKNFRFQRSHVRSLPQSICNNFYKRFNVTSELWFCEVFDATCVAQNITSPFNSNAYLPVRFEGGGSKMRTLTNAFDYVFNTWGAKSANQLMNSMQVSSGALNFPEKEISIRIFSELHQRLRMFGAEDQHFIEMGSFNRFNKNNKRMFSQLIPKGTIPPHKLISYFFNNLISSIDRNVSFSVIECTDSSLILKTTPGELYKKAFTSNENDSGYEIGLYRLGHIKVIPTYFNLNEMLDSRLEYDKATGNCEYHYSIKQG